jgi:hypothetical protein
MRGDASGRIVGLSVALVLTSACTRSAMPAREASAAPPRGTMAAEGAAEVQAGDATAPATAPTPPAATQRPASDGSEPGRDPHQMRRVLGWVSLSVGAEAAVVAVVTSVIIEHQKSIRDDGCNAQKVCNLNGFNAANTISTITPWNTATWFVAAAGLGAGTVLLLISQPRSEQRTAITLSPESSGLQLGLRSTF